MYAIGLMTGTSLDGLDVALCDITGCYKSTQVKLVDFLCVPIDEELQQKIKQACDEKKSNNKLICTLDFELGKLYLKGVQAIIQKNHLKNEDIAFVASHGQTIYHYPVGDTPSTLQIGQPSFITYHTGIKVIFNFRVMDMVAKGQGAPLVPYVDYLLYQNDKKSMALQNIGGISNVTFLEKGKSIENVIAFDNGPGNMMINEAMKVFYQKDYDKNGEIARSGVLVESLMDELKNHPYLQVKPPKSTGREAFGEFYAKRLLEKYYLEKPENIIHTLTAFTAFCIADSYKRFLNEIPDCLIVSGGGAHNAFLMELIQKELPDVEVSVHPFTDAKEAVAFAILGNEYLHDIPANVPSATGAEASVILGMVCEKGRVKA